MWMVQVYDLVAQEFRAYEFGTRAEAKEKEQELKNSTWAHRISVQYWS